MLIAHITNKRGEYYLHATPKNEQTYLKKSLFGNDYKLTPFADIVAWMKQSIAGYQTGPESYVKVLRNRVDNVIIDLVKVSQ